MWRLSHCLTALAEFPDSPKGFEKKKKEAVYIAVDSQPASGPD